jgi:hypothetical protein
MGADRMIQGPLKALDKKAQWDVLRPLLLRMSRHQFTNKVGAAHPDPCSAATPAISASRRRLFSIFQIQIIFAI